MYYWGGFTIILNISTKTNLIDLDLNVFEEKNTFFSKLVNFLKSIIYFFKVSGFFKE